MSGADQNGTIDVGTLTNSLKTETSLTKDWVNSDGTAVTKDYLGCDISVTFALQAAISSEGGTAASSLTWRPAAELLKEKLDPDDYTAVMGSYTFEQTVSGRVNEDWKTVKFKDLPACIKSQDGTALKIRYRIVETAISYQMPGEQEVKISVQTDPAPDGSSWTYKYTDSLLAPACPGNENSYDLNDRTVYNGLQTSALTVKKNWEDSGNAYRTRPEAGQSGKDWEASFLIQRSAGAGQDWESVQVYSEGKKEGAPLILTLYGANGDAAAQKTISNLPKGRYRAVELQPEAGPTQDQPADAKDAAKTGDTAPLSVWGLLFAAAACSGGAALLMRKSRKKKSE